MLLPGLIVAALANPQPAIAAPAAKPAIVTTASGLRFETLEAGSGRRPTLEDAVRVTYEGRLADGRLFDSADEPVGLRVAGLIPGFTEALLLMNKGGKYRIGIPPSLAYGARGTTDGSVPPNAELIFTIKLIAIGRAAPAPAAAESAPRAKKGRGR